MTTDLTIRRPERAELPVVADAYTAANLHDPVLSWVAGGEDTRPLVTRGTWRETTLAYLEGILDSGELVIADDGSGSVAGIALWTRIDAPGPPDPEGTAFIEHAYGEHAGRMRLMIELTERRRPKAGPYWYLLNIVVDPDRRGRGIGGALLRERLSRLDAEGEPAYLEASSPRNRRLYERAGFTGLGGPIQLPNGPRLQPMWRAAS